MWQAFYEVSPYAYFNNLESYTLEGEEIKFVVNKDNIRFIGFVANDKHILISIPVQLFLNHNVQASKFDGYIGMHRY